MQTKLSSPITIKFEVLHFGRDIHDGDVAEGVEGGKIRQVARYETRQAGNRDMTFLDKKRSGVPQ